MYHIFFLMENCVDEKKFICRHTFAKRAAAESEAEKRNQQHGNGGEKQFYVYAMIVDEEKTSDEGIDVSAYEWDYEGQKTLHVIFCADVSGLLPCAVFTDRDIASFVVDGKNALFGKDNYMIKDIEVDFTDEDGNGGVLASFSPATPESPSRVQQ